MPGMDGTGPSGYGPMTGGRRGPCAGDVVGGGRGMGQGMGRGMGAGGGRGRRNRYYETGLTGWQRATAGEAQSAPVTGADQGAFGRLDDKLTEVLARLDRLEAAEQK